MTITAVRRIAVAGVGILAVFALASCSSTESKAKDDVKKIDSKIHSAVVKAYDDTKSALDKAADKVGDGSKSVYDKSKQDLESFGGDLEDASSKTGDDAKRAYRDIQHRFDDMDRDIDRHLHRPANDIGDAEYDAWGDVKDGYHHVKNEIDNLIDKL